MEIIHYHEGMIKPEKAIEILAKNNVVLTIDEAKNLLELLYFLANLSVDQYVKI